MFAIIFALLGVRRIGFRKRTGIGSLQHRVVCRVFLTNRDPALLASKITGIAYETVEVNRRLPLLEPMSEIAGRMSVLMGGSFLQKHLGGCGVLLGGVPGVLPGKVVVIGGVAEAHGMALHKYDPAADRGGSAI